MEKKNNWLDYQNIIEQHHINKYITLPTETIYNLSFKTVGFTHGRIVKRRA